jgi:dephospho-CoA kinase
MSDKMTVIGITGGIGTGKSMVGKILSDMGYPVIDSDLYAREAVKKGMPAYLDIVGYFGRDILDGSGEIDRSRLASLVFNDKEKLERLNSFTHDRILKMMFDEIEKIRAAGSAKIVALEVPIPVKNGFLDKVDRVWVVQAPRSARIDRLKMRNGFGDDKIEQIFQAQMPEEEYVKIADVVLNNDGNISHLKNSIENELRKLCYN